MSNIINSVKTLILLTSNKVIEWFKIVKISSSSGGFVNVEIKGVAEAINYIRQKGKDIVDGKDAKTFQASNFLQQEVQESIIGNRAEQKSVDTGNFGNSIQVDKIDKLKYRVFTNVDYAKYLEYGTIYIQPRSHFRNSLARNRQKVIDIIKQKV